MKFSVLVVVDFLNNFNGWSEQGIFFLSCIAFSGSEEKNRIRDVLCCCVALVLCGSMVVLVGNLPFVFQLQGLGAGFVFVKSWSVSQQRILSP